MKVTKDTPIGTRVVFTHPTPGQRYVNPVGIKGSVCGHSKGGVLVTWDDCTFYPYFYLCDNLSLEKPPKSLEDLL